MLHLTVVGRFVCVSDPGSYISSDCTLVGSTLLGRFQVKGQMKNSTWPSRLRVGRRANNPSLSKTSYYGNRKYFSRIVWDRRRDWPETSGLWYRVYRLPEPDDIGGWKPLWSPPTERVTSTPMGKRKVGRPKTTWRRTVEKERAIAGWKSWEEARALARDRDKWTRSSVALCATERREDRWRFVM